MFKQSWKTKKFAKIGDRCFQRSGGRGSWSWLVKRIIPFFWQQIRELLSVEFAAVGKLETQFDPDES